jgi:hypothetical protein
MVEFAETKHSDSLSMKYANLSETVSHGIQKSCGLMQQKWVYFIEKCRREIALMQVQGHKETVIAQLLGYIDTICRDVKVIKQLSQRCMFEFTKGDLIQHYRLCNIVHIYDSDF